MQRFASSASEPLCVSAPDVRAKSAAQWAFFRHVIYAEAELHGVAAAKVGGGEEEAAAGLEVQVQLSFV